MESHRLYSGSHAYQGQFVSGSRVFQMLGFLSLSLRHFENICSALCLLLFVGLGWGGGGDEVETLAVECHHICMLRKIQDQGEKITVPIAHLGARYFKQNKSLLFIISPVHESDKFLPSFTH